MLPGGVVSISGCLTGARRIAPGMETMQEQRWGLLTPENETAERWVGLCRSGILVKHTPGSDPAVQALKPSEPGVLLLTAIGDLGSLKSVVRGLLFFS